MKQIAAMSINLAMVVVLSGCAGLSDTEQRTLTGGVLGAGAGGIIGAIAGGAGWGALIGGATGAAGGFLFGKHKETEEEAYQRGRADASRGR